MKKTWAVLLTGGMMALQGCASAALDKRVDEKLAGETAIQNRTELSADATRRIDSASGLSAEQRAQLTELRKSTSAEIAALGSQSLKLRALLVRDLITTNYDEDEVALIKQRIKTVEDKRVSLIFDAVEKANSILGRQAKSNADLMGEFFEEPRGGRVD